MIVISPALQLQIQWYLGFSVLLCQMKLYMKGASAWLCQHTSAPSATPRTSLSSLHASGLSAQLPHFSCVQQPSLWPRARSMFGEKCRTLNPVFSSFKLSACLWLEPSRQWRSHWWFQPIDCELPLQMNSSVKGIWRFHRKTRSSSRRKDVHERQRAPNILLYSSLTRQLFGSFPRHIDIYRRIKVLIWLSSGKSHVWHFHRVFTRPPPQSLGIQKQAREII